MIKVENIKKSFGSEVILDGISLEIREDDFVAIMGPSGSGKSTLLYSISGMDQINAGRILYDSKNIAAMTEKELSDFRLNQMGFVFQNAQMLKNLNILDNIILPGLVAAKEPTEVIRKRAKMLMEKLEIISIAEHDVKEVSGGQLQRASICRAMINNPKVLFMDEPTGALNREATDQVLAILQKLNQEGVCIVMVTHDSYVAGHTKRTIHIMDGKLTA